MQTTDSEEPMKFFSLEYPIDRGPTAWARYAVETIQFGPHPDEAFAWGAMSATIGAARADGARIVRVDEEVA